ncbi:RagB/SusD family nutrient uptake outer membrane protein [Aquimarina sp. U1-2]|uniref:RagB/SusD family nutrient uptake outer membrane protein n=1 Tax=Aquimarina sp. U1-2 TaxID=2823141 RepID=UPI001AECC26B|nr:RagB/SusD family nutrient uptake outer membrane protein [Aquimarina sp. U1-2]MBP2830676.1 RagB/SusD family nutrient uptake outer membrane protein [Aquimarina sp. U1-2]
MKKHNKSITIQKVIWNKMILLLFGTLSIVSCSEDFLEEDPANIVVAEDVFVDKAGVQSALNGLYHEVRKERMGSNGQNESGGGDLRFSIMVNGTDNVFALNPGRSSGVITSQFGGANNSAAGYTTRIFGWLYRTINAANTIVDRSENPEIEWSLEEKNEAIAEAKTVRAWAYRHLTYLWGDVPISLKESTGDNIITDWQRSPLDEVFAVMESDLLFAETWLPTESRNPGTVSKAVAQHYLAELYIRMGKPDLAERKAQAVISGPYALITSRYGVRAAQPGVPFMDQFYDGNVLRSQGNTEVLWAIVHENGIDNPDQGRNIMRRFFVGFYRNINGIAVSVDRGGRGIGRLGMTNWALSIYGPEDERNSEFAITKGYTYTESEGDSPPDGFSFGDTIETVAVPEDNVNPSNRNTYPHCRKWEWADPANLNLNEQYGDQPYLRLADTYLLLAEAQLAQGNTSGAAEAINVVRRRANASEITAAEVNLDFLLDERSREFLCEEQRRYCLVRNNKLIERTRLYNLQAGPNITERDRLFPIPQSVIDANLTNPMRQNNGYQ